MRKWAPMTPAPIHVLDGLTGSINQGAGIKLEIESPALRVSWEGWENDRSS